MSLSPKPNSFSPRFSLSYPPLSSDFLKNPLNIDIYSERIENRLHSQLQNLKNNLTVLEDNNLNSPSVDEEDRNDFPEVNPELKSFLKNTMFQITEALEERLTKDGLYQLLPESYVEKQIETIQSTLLTNLDKAKELFTQEGPNKGQKGIALGMKYGRGKIKLPKSAKNILNEWYINNQDDPYPTPEQKMKLAEESQISLKQVNNWFINMRGKTCSKSYRGPDFNHQIQKKLQVGSRK